MKEIPPNSLFSIQPRASTDSARTVAPDVFWGSMQWLLGFAKAAAETVRRGFRSLRDLLVNQREKQWRLTSPTVLNGVGEWSWSRAQCRIVSSDRNVVVSLGMHDHDITAVEAVVHDSVLAIRIELESGTTLRRAEPVATVTAESVAHKSWDREEVRIELQR